MHDNKYYLTENITYIYFLNFSKVAMFEYYSNDFIIIISIKLKNKKVALVLKKEMNIKKENKRKYNLKFWIDKFNASVSYL